MNSWAKYGAIMLAVFAALFGAYQHGCAVTQATADLKEQRAARQAADDLAALSEHYRKKERASREAMAAIDEQHQEDLRNEKIIAERTIAGLRDGTVRLRDKFAACAASTVVPHTGAGTGQRNDAATGGLQTEDVDFLVSTAARADEVALQLRACQAIVKRDRELP